MSEQKEQQTNERKSTVDHPDFTTRLSKVEVRQENYERELQRLHGDIKDLSVKQRLDMKEMSEKQDRQHDDMLQEMKNMREHSDKQLEQTKESLLKQVRLWIMALGLISTVVFSLGTYINSQTQLKAQQVYSEQQQEQQDGN